MVSVTATWSGSYARDPVAYAPGPPAITPLAVPVANTAGQWLFALVSWRQDAGTAGTLQYPSTVRIDDDAGNFWIPVYSGLAATASGPNPATGIVRCAVWMAPAARAAQYVFAEPAAYQSSLTVLVAEVPGACPWYQVQAVAGGFTNQGTSVSLSQTIPSGVFALGMMAWDNSSGSVTPVATGWTSLANVTASNGNDHSGDLRQDAWYVTGSGASLTLSASGTPTMDWADVIVVISGVADLRAFPYSLASTAENWPVLVTEIAAGPALNLDPVFADGTTYWTGTGAAVAAVSWPLWQPIPSAYQAVQYGSLQITPTGASTTASAGSETEAVSPVTQYTAIAWVYSPAGYGVAASATGVYAGIAWYTSGLSLISTTAGTTTILEPGEWTQLTAGPVFPPGNAAFGQMVVAQTGHGNDVSASAVLYAGYAAFSVADAYEAVPADQIAWTDISARNFTQGELAVSRGIQYENQSLEAGEMTAYLVNYDAEVTFGNVQSLYWPNIGDTDVPVRLRAIWPGSLTPYCPMFSGYTDDVKYGWDHDEETWWAYASVTASDTWSRLTQQMLAVTEQESLLDNPAMYAPCSDTGANIALSSYGSAAIPVPAPLGSHGATQSFTGSGVSLAGAPGLSCWQSAGTQTADPLGRQGWALTWFSPTPIVITGNVLEWWFNPVSLAADQPSPVGLVLCTCWSSGFPLWTLWVDNTSTAAVTYANITVYDKVTRAATTTQVGTAIAFLNGTATDTFMCAVSFTETSLTVTFNPGGTPTETVTVSADFYYVFSGFSWGGNAGPVAFELSATGAGGAFTTYGFMDMAVQGVALYNETVPAARVASHYEAGNTGFAMESDNWRLARVAGYSGFIPPLAMRGLDLPAAPAADVDVVTGATDTNTQVVSAYFTNVASSTDAAMFVNGAGALVYRRRAEWYNRPLGQWVLGELDSLTLSAGVNPLSQTASFTGWGTQNGATLTISSQPAAGPGFVPYAGVFHGNGSTANPGISFKPANGGSAPVTPGDWYIASCWAYSVQGFTSGLVLDLGFLSSGGSDLADLTYTAEVPAAGLVYLQAGPFRAPASAAFAAVTLSANGTPASTVLFNVAGVQVAQVNPDYAGGAGVAVAETPYYDDVQISSDRAQLFNYAVLTQYGTNLISSFSGTDVLFTPSSGVTVIISNQPSVNLRGQVPYTATIYLDNTVQATPYYLNEGSIEDFGNWITQTLGSPLFRPDQVTITPVATPSALIMGLQAEVGDTTTFRRRQLGVPETQILTYNSKLTHSIDKARGHWETGYELSPVPQASVLVADDVVHGVLTGANLLGW